MPRSLFDPAKASGSEAAAQAAVSSSQLTVTQAVNLIKNTLETRLPSPLKVIGEISNFKNSSHWYFSLKETDAVLHCVAWATTVRKFKFKPKDGDEIVATGSVSHFAPQGKTQLYVTDVQPVGAGVLELRYRALCDELRGLGYFEESRKKALPIFPRRIAVITSASSAAVQDVLNTASQRCKAVGVLIVDVRVQGEGSAKEVAHAIRWVDRNRTKLGVDAMLVTRGGGSIEDLWAFNERIVADAVFKCTLPVVAAIGHESDTTIVELVADLRASTPTQAVMRLFPSSQELCAQLDHLSHRISSVARRQIEREKQRLVHWRADHERILRAFFIERRSYHERLRARLERLQPEGVLTRRKSELGRLCAMLSQSVSRYIQLQRTRVSGLQRHLEAVSPMGVLERGYSITATAEGTVVRSIEQAKAGDLLVTRVFDGSLKSIVEDNASRPNRNKHKSPSPSTDSADQLGLFAGEDGSR